MMGKLTVIGAALIVLTYLRYIDMNGITDCSIIHPQDVFSDPDIVGTF